MNDQLSNEQLLKRDALSLYMQLQLGTCEIIKCVDNPNKNLVTCIELRCYITVTENMVQEEHMYITK